MKYESLYDDSHLPDSHSYSSLYDRNREKQGCKATIVLKIFPISAPLSKTFLDEAADTEHGLEVEGQVEDVQRQQAQQVDVEGGGVGVVLPQLHRLRLQHPVLQITCGEKLCQV